MACSGCGKNKPIVNKKRELCGDCNYARLNGCSRQEMYTQRQAERPKKIYKIESKRQIKRQTVKESKVKKELSAIKHDIELDALQSGEYYCWGCGKAEGALDKSHILSVGRFKHLELDKRNMNLFDRDCHKAWESGDIGQQVRLLTFEKDFLYMCEKSRPEAQKFLTKMWDYYENKESPDSQVVSKILKIIEIIGKTVL